MADLTLRINGDAEAARKALEDAGISVKGLGDDVGKSVAKWQALADVTKKAVESVVRWGVDAVKAYAEAERVQRQLVRTSGQYADALDEQAQALMRLNAVDDDIIKQSAILLTQWGGVGAATKKTQQAILDYAAATGQDAVSATQDLIRNVESGGTGLAKMGVHFKATGDKGHDLASAVDALNKKFGGAAAADAESLHGRLGAVSLAWDDFTKAAGESIAKLLEASGAVELAQKVLIGLKKTLAGEDEQTVKAGIEREKQVYALRDKLLTQQIRLEESLKTAASLSGPAAEAYGHALDSLRAEIAATQKEIDDLNMGVAKAAQGGGGVTGAPGVKGQTNRGMADAKQHAEEMKKLSEKVAEDTRAAMKRDEELADQAEAERQQDYAKELQNTANFVKDRIKLDEDTTKARIAIRLDEEKKEAEIAERQHKREQELQERSAKEEKERLAKREAQAKAAGDAIGAAFVNAMADQLQKLAEGGEFDAALFVGDVLASIVGVAAGIIGTAYGMPALGAAVGNLASMGIRAGFGAMSASAKKARGPRTMHSGGWVGDEAELPRYHSGTWVGTDERPAILQTGERVLSRSEVARMGGQGGVDAAARGRGGVTVNISAIDSKSAADSFVSDLGRGMRLALRRGQGDLPALLGAGPR